jgi:membrane protein implicated in regulation of membrane protease activity
MSRFVRRPFLIALGVLLVLFVPVYEVGLILDWSPTVAGWWSLFVIGLSTIVWTRLAEREERARKSHGRGRQGRHTDR